jgi:hypothetical protein
MELNMADRPTERVSKRRRGSIKENSYNNNRANAAELA